MTIEEYNKSVGSIIKLIVANNPGGVAKGLRQAGYETKDYIPASELESALYQLHSANSPQFYEVLKTVSWNQGNNNWTNEPQYREQITELIADTTATNGNAMATTRGVADWFKTALDYLQEQSTTVVTTPGKLGAGFYIGLFLVVGGIFAIVYFGIKELKKSKATT